jgi:hypothetical protein
MTRPRRSAEPEELLSGLQRIAEAQRMSRVAVHAAAGSTNFYADASEMHCADVEAADYHESQ